jgi:uncharacterized protein (DUF1697 family)
MDRLRDLFGAMGFSDIETFIASGNVVFDATSADTKDLERKIEDWLQEALGYRVATFVRTTSELAAIAERKPFSASDLEAEGNALYVAFVAQTPSDEAKEKLLSFATDDDAFYVDQREIYWLCRGKISDSKFSGALLEKALGLEATMRNSTTVRRMAAKYV